MAGELVLVVDDDPAVRRLLETGLQKAGFRVVTAVDGVAAVRTLDADTDERRLDLVLTDVRMPQLDGPGLAAIVRSRRPDLPVVFMTGNAGEDGNRLGDETVIMKPFTVDTVVDRLRTVLLSRHPGGQTRE